MEETTEYSTSISESNQSKKTKPTRDELKEKAIKLIAGTLDTSQESDSNMERIKEIRMAILTGTEY